MAAQKKFSYQEQDSKLTLRQGVAEHFASHPGLLQDGDLDQVSRQLFHSHDVCHVVFGLDTTLMDEALADCWTLVGTDVGGPRYYRYLRESKAARDVIRQIGYGRTLAITITGLPKITRTLWRAWRMKKKWPWQG